MENHADSIKQEQLGEADLELVAGGTTTQPIWTLPPQPGKGAPTGVPGPGAPPPPPTPWATK
jgi:hypothetical protein